MVLDVARQDDGVLKVIKASGDREHPANAGRLCTKGATSAELLAAPGRLDTALVRPGRGSGAAGRGRRDQRDRPPAARDHRRARA
jgi:sulfite reductase (NADPH) flavoprotein alpha-component